ncbi:hypothetical protein Q3G72_014558 [Acer saccharum]|nr:hypothetical protein Q3G72_014558 [Acer saccharum]
MNGDIEVSSEVVPDSSKQVTSSPPVKQLAPLEDMRYLASQLPLNETEPIKNETYLKAYPPKMKVLESVLKGMKNHVTYLNITRLTDYRKDGHPSVHRKHHLSKEEKKLTLKYQDCSHWCLPGVPDAWNELFYAELLIKENKMLQHQNQKRFR